MPTVQTISRNQLQTLSLEELIPQDHLVRLIDDYCNTFDPEQLGFIIKGTSLEGRPAFAAADMIRLYIYGYINGVRSSRKLEQECLRNVELWWLLNSLRPKYRAIAAFRHDNASAFHNLFGHFRDFCISLGLYGKKTIAIDGSKFRAQNSKKNNYNKKKILQHLDYIEEQTQLYMEELDINDKKAIKGLPKKKKKIFQDLDKRKKKYKELEKQLEESEDTQISTVDPDAKALPIKRTIVEVGYNIQTATDDKNNLIAEFHTTNGKDDIELVPMIEDTKLAFGMGDEDEITVLADKGYHTGSEIKKCHEMNVDTLIAPKKRSKRVAFHVQKDKFNYNKKNDTYTCPQGMKLHRVGSTYHRKARDGTRTPFHRYQSKLEQCRQCPFLNECISKTNQNKNVGRMIDRFPHDEAIEKNASNVKARMQEYRRRQAIVEHPYGHLKRNLGYTYTLLKGIELVDAEFCLIFLTYNFKRTIQILKKNEFKNALKKAIISNLRISSIMAQVRAIFYFSINRVMSHIIVRQIV